MTTTDRPRTTGRSRSRVGTLRRGLGVAGIGLILVACAATSVSTREPTLPSTPAPNASSNPPSPTVATSVDVDAIIATSEATNLGLHHDYVEVGRTALTYVVRSGRAAEFEALDGFIDGRLSGFSGDAGALLSAALVFDTAEHAGTAFDLFLHEIQSPEAYGFGAGEAAGLGDEGVCDAGPNPYLDGLVESICLWRNGTFVLIAGGPMAMTDIRAVAASMDTRAAREKAGRLTRIDKAGSSPPPGMAAGGPGSA